MLGPVEDINRKFQGVMIKSTGNPGGQLLKKLVSLTLGVQFSGIFPVEMSS